MPLIEHSGGAYAIQLLYALPDDAWYLELTDLARNATLAIGIVPDEDPDREPTVCLTEADTHHHVPYDVMRWFMDEVDREIRANRGWMDLRPELVRIIRGLREMHQDGVIRDDFPALLALLRASVPPEDLDAVVEGAFGADLGVLAEPTPQQVTALRDRMAEDGWAIG